MDGPARHDPSLRALLRRIAARRVLLSAVALIVFTIVALWTFLATPRYRSFALLRIDTRGGTPGLTDALKDIPGAGLAGLGKDDLETEVGVLKSDRMVDAAVDALALSVIVKPGDDRASVIRARILDSGDVDGDIVFSRRDDNRYDVEYDALDEYSGLPKVLAPGDSMRVGSVMLGLPATLSRTGAKQIAVKLLPRYKVHERLSRRLSILQQEGGSRLVEVAFEDPDRRLAAAVVDRIVQEYVKYSLETDLRQEGIQRAELQDALASSSVRLGASEDRLRQFQERAKLIVPDVQAEEQVKRIGLIGARLDATTIERNALARLLDIIEKRSRGGNEAASFRQLATFPSLITNRAIQDLLQALIEQETKRSVLLVTRNESNAEVQQFTSRITDLEQQLYRLGSQYLESLDQQLSATSRTVASLTDTLVALPAAAMRYQQLLRESKISNEEYLQLIKQMKFAQIQELLRKEKVHVVDAPRVGNADDPVFPKKRVQLVLGIVLAIVVAFAVGLTVELWTEPEIV